MRAFPRRNRYILCQPNGGPFQSLFLGLSILLIQPGFAASELLVTCSVHSGEEHLFLTRSSDGFLDDAPLDLPAHRFREASVNPIFAHPSGRLLLNESTRIRINLFDDLCLPVKINRVESSALRTSAFICEVSEFPEATAILTESNGILAGSIHLPGLGSFLIIYIDENRYGIAEIDASIVRNCQQVVCMNPSNDRHSVEFPIPLDTPSNGQLSPGPITPTDGPGAARANNPDQPANCTEIRLMVIYTPQSLEQAGGVETIESLIDLAIVQTNESFLNSGLNVRMRCVYKGLIDYEDYGVLTVDYARLKDPADGFLDQVTRIKRETSADIVSLWATSRFSTRGAGTMLTQENAGMPLFNVIRWQHGAVNYTFTHEIGHNLGCAHDRYNIDVPGFETWARGHRFRANDGIEYRTIMAYAPGTRIPYFSNPRVRFKGIPTGLSRGFGFGADNASIISVTAPRVGAATETNMLREYPRLTIQRANDQFRLSIEGPPGQPVLIEASKDLVNWIPLSTLVLDSETGRFLEVQRSESPYRFFRCRRLPSS